MCVCVCVCVCVTPPPHIKGGGGGGGGGRETVAKEPNKNKNKTLTHQTSIISKLQAVPLCCSCTGDLLPDSEALVYVSRFLNDRFVFVFVRETWCVCARVYL